MAEPLSDSPRAARDDVERRAGAELWLLRPGDRVELAQRLQAFAGAPLTRILSVVDEQAQEWAAAFARSLGRPFESLDVAPASAASSDPAEPRWSRLETLLAQGESLLVVLPQPGLQALVARALGLPTANATNLRVDPGRAVLLRAEPIGIVLRRSNVLGPATETGTALPSGTQGSAR